MDKDIVKLTVDNIGVNIIIKDSLARLGIIWRKAPERKFSLISTQLFDDGKHERKTLQYKRGPRPFCTRGRFLRRQFFNGPVVGKWFQDDSSILNLLCTLFLLLLYQLHLRSSGIGSWRLGIPTIQALSD